MQLERKSSTNINFNTASILSLKVKQQNIIFYLFFFGSYFVAHFTIHFSNFFEATSILKSFSGKMIFTCLRELVFDSPSNVLSKAKRQTRLFNKH